MAEPEENSLFAIDVDTDDYATAAAADTPAPAPEDRTYQSPAAFASVKSSYVARQDAGDHYAELRRNLPCLEDPASPRLPLDKRDQLLLGYVVGELWYDGRKGEVRGLCKRVLERCVVEGRARGVVEGWVGRLEKVRGD